nr:hypothetical protein [Tanacetum cinerariifolium]
MSDASSTVTYTSVYTDSDTWRYYREESAETKSPGVVVYGYDGLPIELVAPPSLDYPEYPEYLAPSDDEAPLEDQPLPADALPTAASLGYVADSDLDEDPKEDSEDDHADYPDDGWDRAPLGYSVAEIRMRALLPSTSHRCNIPEADVTPRKRDCLTNPTPGFK